MMYPYYGYGYYGMGWSIWGGIVHAVLVVVTVLIVLWIIRRLVWGRGGGHGRLPWRGRWAMHSGLEILNERYAKGEIDKAEYEERKKTLLGE